jgi:hypothetical protein
LPVADVRDDALAIQEDLKNVIPPDGLKDAATA